MKLSNKPTAHILVKANSTSEWDYCEFAIIHLSEEWKTAQKQRLEWVAPLHGKPSFCSMNFYDTAVDFYGVGDNDLFDTGELLAGKEWVFVELDNEEQQTFTPTENRLNCYRLVVRPNGTAYYTAYGKHTGEEFWTEEFSLTQLTRQL